MISRFWLAYACSFSQEAWTETGTLAGPPPLLMCKASQRWVVAEPKTGETYKLPPTAIELKPSLIHVFFCWLRTSITLTVALSWT